MSEFTLGAGFGLWGKVDNALARGGWTHKDVDEACEGNTFAKLLRVKRGELVVSERPPPAERIVDTRNVLPPRPPSWVMCSEHHHCAPDRPARYDLAKVRLWRAPGQKLGRDVSARYIHEQLIEKDKLQYCLSTADGVAIQKLGAAVFREVFGANSLFLWRTLFRDTESMYHVQYLYGEGDNGGGDTLAMRWFRLDGTLSDCDPAGLYPK